MAGSKNSFFEVTFLISFLILALVYPVLAEKGEAKQPWFCHGIECPEYITKVRSGDKFEVRSYPQAKWVSTVVKVDTIKDFNDAQNDAFLRLFKYISGRNEAKAKIEMTAPVLEEITVGQGPFCANGLKQSFYVPAKFQGKTPNPTNPDIKFTTYGPATYYVRSFSTGPPGPSAQRIIKEAEQLAIDLNQANITDFDPETYFFAAYDPPFRLLFRHDEIWFAKKSSKTRLRPAQQLE